MNEKRETVKVDFHPLLQPLLIKELKIQFIS